MERVYYVYRHIRLDKNTPFYIGRGTKARVFNTHCQEYKRAYIKTIGVRTKHWQNIFNISEIQVDILYETTNFEEIKLKETEFIRMYGREDLGLGTLINLSDGGEGISGYVMSETTKAKKSGSNNKGSKPVYVYDNLGQFINKFDCISTASKILGCSAQQIGKHIIGKHQHAFKNRYFLEYQGESIEPLVIIKPQELQSKQVLQMDVNNQVLMKFKSVSEASRILGVSRKKILSLCKGDKYINQTHLKFSI